MRLALALTLFLLGCRLPAPPASTPEPTATVVVEPTATIATLADRWIAPPPTKTSGCQAHDGEPDSQCTPGTTDPRVTQANIATTICRAGYSASVRPSTSVTEPIKRSAMLAYGLVGQPLSGFELDHLVSLELGGAPADVANLWPEPYTGEPNAHEKDVVENSLHEQVCRGSMQLAEAQREIATDWRAISTV